MIIRFCEGVRKLPSGSGKRQVVATTGKMIISKIFVKKDIFKKSFIQRLEATKR